MPGPDGNANHPARMISVTEGLATVMVTRLWINEMEVPPSELARLKWVQARAAYTAGASAWQNGSRASVASAS